MGTPELSVIMPAYNVERYITEALDSVLAQTFTNFELLVTDDASTDRTTDIIAQYNDPRIKFLRHQKNMGAIFTRNVAIQKSRAAVIACMDADDISQPERFSMQIEHLRNNPDIVLLGTAYEKMTMDGTPIINKQNPETDIEIRNEMKKRNAFCSPSVMFRKSILTLSSDYREIAGPVGEDYDLFLRILDHGKGANLPETLYRYRVNPYGITSGADWQDIRALNSLIVKISEQRTRNGIDPLAARDPEILQETEKLKKSINSQKNYNQRKRMARHWLVIAEEMLDNGNSKAALSSALKSFLLNPLWRDFFLLIISMFKCR